MSKVSLNFTKLLISSLFVGLVVFAVSCKKEEKSKETVLVSCTMEKMNDTAIIADNNDAIMYKNRKLINVDEVYSGMYSIKLDSIRQFALTTKQNLKSDKIYVISFWKNSSADEVYVVAQYSLNIKDFYINSKKVIEEGQNGWKKVAITFSIPEKLNDKTFEIYLWNASKADVYIDDFTIIEKPKNEEKKETK